MRKSEITPELIELSKKAKELGFPQEIENGEWALVDEQPELVGTYYIAKTRTDLSDYAVLILSFSRCLEWLKERGVVRVDIVETERKVTLWVVFEKGLDRSLLKPDAKTHHEAIAKAVIKILEES